MNNKKLGTNFENKICSKLASCGYWVHFITPDARGAQPFDIIAVKDGIAHAIECKTLTASKNWFTIDRLEENQISAFELWIKRNNTEPLIAIEWNNNILVVEYSELKRAKKINMKELAKKEEKRINYVF